MNPEDLVAYGPLLLAIPVGMVAGLVSFLSPCCLPLVPGVPRLRHRHRRSRRRSG
jgi:cytochrome c-type biogenesis protein